MTGARVENQVERLLRPDGATLAFKRCAGAGPVVVWMGGFHSDMEGSKALALHHWAERSGRAFLRFDYFGHGASSGEFAGGTIGRWRDDCLALTDALAKDGGGELLLVGSSMGAWLACLTALARPRQVAAMVLIAPAIDFTEALLKPQLSQEAHIALQRDGVWIRSSPYDLNGYPITRDLLDDGADWRLLPGPIKISAPIRIMQGAEDADVPWRHALSVYEAIESQDMVLTLVKDGDHRLSRPQDIERLIATVEDLHRRFTERPARQA